MLVLGIETSCDDTAAAVLRDDRHVLSNVVASQLTHREYGGVVPEIASRQHLKHLLPVMRAALQRAEALPLQAIDRIAGGVRLPDGAAGKLAIPVVVVALRAGDRAI